MTEINLIADLAAEWQEARAAATKAEIRAMRAEADARWFEGEAKKLKAEIAELHNALLDVTNTEVANLRSALADLMEATCDSGDSGKSCTVREALHPTGEVHTPEGWRNNQGLVARVDELLRKTEGWKR